MGSSKTCSHCGEDKPAEKFYKNTNNPDGLTHNCKICRLEYQKGYYKENNIERIEYQARYESREEVKERKREYVRNRLKNDPEFKVTKILRQRIHSALKSGEHKCDKSKKLLGCSIPCWVDYLEDQFTEEMSWENHGEVWHIDHIRPLASFNLIEPEKQRLAFNYKNTQPLLAEENLSKGASWEGDPETWELNLDD